ncbi:hypothetical protein [Schaalia sp. lx-100]|uniref:hypothetical protein n=1 Tax=Schaalia sp. lx-100 TaxID=2899081 RepID=UPI001E285329|nr:hypothetical protein [Schaalia sp. lx-100]MCD4558220.1 hypothetical protein [Schaalia sp. lx-100]
MTSISAVKLVVYEPWGQALHTVTDISSLEWAGKLCDHSTLSVTLPAGSPQAACLRDMVEVALLVKIKDEWIEPAGARFFTTGYVQDPVKDFGATTISMIGISTALRFESVTIPTPDDEEGKRVFPAQSPGSILCTLFNEARSRDTKYGLEWAKALEWSFSAQRDSHNQPWGKNARCTFAPSASFEKVLEWLSSKGAVEWRMNARALEVYRSGGFLSRRNESVAFIDAYAEAAPVTTSFEYVSTLARFRGKDGKQWEKNNPNAARAFGRIVKWNEQGQVERDETASLYLEEVSKRGQDPRRQYRREWTLTGDPESPLPWVDYNLGDWVNASGSELRVRETGVKLAEDGTWSAWVTLGDRIEALLERLARKTTDLSDGMVGGENSPVVGVGGPRAEKGTPQAPVDLLASSDPVSDASGAFHSVLTLSWAPVSLTTENREVTVEEYLVEVTKNGDKTRYYTCHEPKITIQGYPGERWRIRVRARSAQNVWGLWSSALEHVLAIDKEPPPQPARPQVEAKLGILIVTHSGQSSTGAPMPNDTDYWEVAVSSSSTPQPAVDAKVAYAHGLTWYRSGLDVNKNYYVRVRAVDTSANIGPWSEYVLTQIKPLFDASKLGAQLASSTDALGNLIVQIRDASIIAPGAIKTSHLAALSVSADKIAANAITASHITAGALDAYIVNGSVLQTSPTARRGVKITSTGLYAYDYAGNETVKITGSSGTISGYTISGGVIEQSSYSSKIRISNGRITFSENNQTQMTIDDDGMAIWEGDRKIGYISANNKHDDPTVRGLSMNLHTEGDYVTWSYKIHPSDQYSTTMLTLDPKGRFYKNKPGIHFGNDIWLNGNDFKFPDGSNFAIRYGTLDGAPCTGISSNNNGIDITQDDVYVRFNGTCFSLRKLLRDNGYNV